MDPEELETSTLKVLHHAATKAKEASVSKEHGDIPSDNITHVIVRTTPVPIEFGIPELSLPESENVKVPSMANPAKKVSRFYYNCKHCNKSSQNKASMMTHTRRCINIKLICGGSAKEYDSADYIEKHLNETHKGDIDFNQ